MGSWDCDFLVDDVGLNEDSSESKSTILSSRVSGETLSDVSESSSSSAAWASDGDVSQARDALTSKLRERIRLLAKQRQKKRAAARELEAQSRRLLNECEQLRSKERKLELRIERLEGLLDSDFSSSSTQSSGRVPALDLQALERPESNRLVNSSGVGYSGRSSPRRSVREGARHEVEMFVNAYRLAHRGLKLSGGRTSRSLGEEQMLSQFFDSGTRAACDVSDALRAAEEFDRSGQRVKAYEICHPFVMERNKGAVLWAARQLLARGAYAPALKLQDTYKMTKNAQVTRVFMMVSEHLHVIEEIAFMFYTRMKASEADCPEQDWADLRSIFRLTQDISRRQNNKTINQLRLRARALTESEHAAGWSPIAGMLVSLATLMSLGFSRDVRKSHLLQWRAAADAGDPLGAFLLFRRGNLNWAQASLKMSVSGEAVSMSDSNILELRDCAARGSILACERLRPHLSQIDTRALEALVRVNPGAAPLLIEKIADNGTDDQLNLALSLARELVNRSGPEKASDILTLALVLEKAALKNGSEEKKKADYREAIFRSLEALQVAGDARAATLLHRLLNNAPFTLPDFLLPRKQKNIY